MSVYARIESKKDRRAAATSPIRSCAEASRVGDPGVPRAPHRGGDAYLESGARCRRDPVRVRPFLVRSLDLTEPPGRQAGGDEFAGLYPFPTGSAGPDWLCMVDVDPAV